MLKRLLFLVLGSWSMGLMAQPILKPLQYNANLYLRTIQPSKDLLFKKTASDTLQLPFREDFFQQGIFPDTSLWLNNHVYINGDFGVNPPTYGVATFDYLDANGNPYSTLSTRRSPGDSLTSKPINMTVYQGGALRPGDSVYLSFYFQPQGRGEAPSENDILQLQFKNSFGVWQTMWEAEGSGLKPFEQVLIPIDSQQFFHEAFQFQFVNITQESGNLNHWHIDYIVIDKGRNFTDIYYDDYAIQSRPTSLLKKYASMPYDHFMEDASAESADSIFFNVSNLNNSILNIEVRYSESIEGRVLNSTQFVSNAANVPSGGWEKRRFSSYDFGGLTGEKVLIDRNYELREPSVINRYTNNDALQVQQVFDNYFAYDDGSAEAGFGWDSDVPFPAGTGRIAVKFHFNRPDTLWGLGFFFNQSREDVSRQSFTLKVWSDLELGQGQSTEELYSREVNGPVYTNERNGFYIFKLDSPLVIPAGDFYIGWTQIGTFNLNVGWDMNHGNVVNLENSNPGIYYNILGNWKDWNIAGSPMIRAYVGTEPVLASGSALKQLSYGIYPNPAKNTVYIRGLDKGVFSLYSISGQLVSQKRFEQGQIPCGHVKEGVYFLQIIDPKGQISYQKIIIER